MANTQGFSDEDVESLVTEQRHSLANPLHNSEREDAKPALSHRSMLHRRMETPMGSEPAARVVRKTSHTAPSPPTASTVKKEEPATQPGLSSLAVVGNIVERPRRSRNSRRNKANSSSANNSLGHSETAAAVTQGDNGFPSLRVPLGTFVSSASSTTATTSTPRARATPDTSTGKPGSSFSQLRQETSREADAMLSQMTRQEIDESKRELEQSLSPELVAFLRQRKNPKPVQGKAFVSSSSFPEKKTKVADTKTVNKKESDNAHQQLQLQLQGLKSEEDCLSYERLASIQTYDDLDVAYQAEHDGETDPLFYPNTRDKTNGANSAGEQFKVACDLLRSSVPRQTLWAAQTIHQCLSNDFEHRIRIQRDASSPYPVTLPVSLRCLLDAPASQRSSNGYILHAHVLQSLYLLLRMTVIPDHDVDVSVLDETGVQPSICHSIYQLWCANDAVPSLPVDQCYQASNGMKPITVNGQENAAYTSTSSSDSAVQHGQNFWKDPLWTLLSQMRIIPRLAELVQKTSNLTASGSLSMTRLPNEGLSSICGILAMIAHRSPGAASAIGQHKTLTSNLLTIMLADKDGDINSPTDTGKSGLLLDPSIMTPVIVLFSVLARQSNVAAKALEEPHTEELLTRVLSVNGTDSDGKVSYSKRWSLILWRTLMRYGYGTQFLETVLTVTASQRGRDASKWSCQTEFYSCLTALLRNGPVLASTRYAILSIVKEAIQYLEKTSKYSSLEQRQLLRLATCLDFLKSCKEQDVAPESENQQVALFSADDDRRVQRAFSVFARDSTVLRESIKKCASASCGTIEELNDLKNEAAACCFLSSFLSILHAPWSHAWLHEDDSNSALLALVNAVEEQVKFDTPSRNGCDTKLPFLSLPRCAWQNRCHFWILLSMISAPDCQIKKDSRVLLILIVAFIGKLQCGEETLAQIVLQLCMNGFDKNLTALCKVFLQGLTSSSEASAQLKHSARIFNDMYSVDIDQDQSELPTLNCVLTGPGIKSSELLLPMGTYWVWKVLAGASSDPPSDSGLSGYFFGVIEAACHVVEDVEEASCLYQYNNGVNVGGKLYYLMNLCLQDESILVQEKLMQLAEHLLVKYTSELDRNAVSIFFSECSAHSSGGGIQKEPDENLTEDEEKVKAWLTATDDKPMKDTINFIGDLIKAFTDYGAQYGTFFIHCMRSFLHPAYPTKIRCETIQRLDGLLHLFTVEGHDSGLIQTLLTFLQVFNPSAETTGFHAKEDPEWLDSLADLFAKGSDRFQRPDFCFLRSLAICTLGQTMVPEDKSHETNANATLMAQRQRLQSKDDEFVLSCINMAAFVVQSPETTSRLDYITRAVQLSEGKEGDKCKIISNLNDSAWDKLEQMIQKSQSI